MRATSVGIIFLQIAEVGDKRLIGITLESIFNEPGERVNGNLGTQSILLFDKMLSVPVYHPHIRLDVNPHIFFNIHLDRVECAWDDVFSALWEFYACPLLPFRARPTNCL